MANPTQLLCDVANMACHALVARTDKERYTVASKIAAMIVKAHRRTCSECGQRFGRGHKYRYNADGKTVRHHNCSDPCRYPPHHFKHKTRRAARAR